MPSALGIAKRVVVGRPMHSELLGETLLPKKIALPVFASDALSSVAYATEEILLVLSAGGLALLHFTWWIALAVGLLMLVVVASYRQNVHAYPSGGGDYEVATTNLGPKVGLTVASALMVDYILTVAVSVSSGVANLASAIPALNSHVVLIAVVVIVVITLLNLRGVRESGTAFAVPTYCFVGAVGVMIVTGLVRIAFGHGLHAESEHYKIINTTHYNGVLLIFLLLRAFASGCTALTGVEAISNGVPAFKPPKSKNAATTLALLGGIAVAMFAGVTALALAGHVHAADAANLSGLPAGQQPRTVIAQVARSVFGGSSPFFFILQFVTALILVLAANTAFNGFPVLGSILAKDGYLPRQLHTRGDRLAFSNGIIVLAGFATLLVVAFNASPTRLIQLYIVGVFVSFVCSQTGMIRHWNRLLRDTADAAERRRMMRSRVINAVGAGVTAAVLVIVLVTKFAKGAWIVVLAMPCIWLVMRAINRHYAAVARELEPPEDGAFSLPANNHAVVLVSKLHMPTLRALGYASATRPSSLEAVTVNLDDAEVAVLKAEWERRAIPVPLTVIASPYREITRPIIEYVKRVRTENPDDVVTVYIPQYVLGHWWEQVLHNQSALRLKSRLLFQRRVVVAAVPYQLESASARIAAAKAQAAYHGAAMVKPAPKPKVPKQRTTRLQTLTLENTELEARELTEEVSPCGATPIADCPDRERVVVSGTLRTVRLRPRAGVPVLEADLWDGTGSVTVSWLGRREIPGIAPGRRIVVRGRITTVGGQRAVYNPIYELRPGAAD
ncbi:amino acid permease [Catenulispora sp. NF23]|uniref:Amino acid permease n=1 Tax=Catenulispora pinistramenti TaxID=2705254 RepID=A0ABS5L2L6_9ACTN|nr:amino acid permease [Catenulispora pinistramenti]MBS2536183.1 amino acid permease [Catenulispora pinistramenti]MBS2552484.1 amino acid permease [Catenulispora pinistramenti]